MERPLREEEILVGGQAVIEGVMMRTPHAYAVAVRRPDGSVAIQKDVVPSLAKRFPFLKLPLLRGVATLVQALALGIRTLNYSASVAMDESPAENPQPKKKDATSLALLGSMLAALAFGVAIFILAPLYLTRWTAAYVPALESWVLFNLVDGFFRVLFFILYIVFISRMKDIQRVFEYHGAEHKVVFNREAAEELTVENSRKQSRFHPRCGTSFLLFVMVVSIIVFSIFKLQGFLWIALSRVFLIPLIAGISYEIIRFSARHADRTWLRVVIQPGLWLQRLTTREPSDDQIEVAITALKEALQVEESAVAAAA